MTERDSSLVPEALSYLDPASCSYEEWLRVGMALHAEGYPVDDWDAWSKRDAKRYHPGECSRKWTSFGHGAGEVAGGTIVEMARARGFVSAPSWDDGAPDEALEWDAPIVDPSWVEPAEIACEPWEPVSEAVRYLSALFEPGEYVGYVTTAWLDDDGRWKPKGRGSYSRTAGDLIEELKRTDSLELALGTPNEEAGAWIRFNPLSGDGVRNADVADFRFALVESDDMEVERQKALIDELELPCAMIVHSGGKSLHAIVRVDAADYAEYRKRVDYLYDVCKRNGLALDTQNKNPSRLSRFPGFARGEEHQRIVAGKCGKASWDEWVEWVEEADDGLPDIEPFSALDADVPAAPAPLVDGILMPGDKMMIAGPPKAGKSFALIELCMAIAAGTSWLGRACQKGPVLYVNLELKRDSRIRRMKAVADAMGADAAEVSSVHCLDLRGRTVPLDRLVRSIIRRAAKVGYKAIVIDPIYKVMGGDESDSEAVKRFCDQLDRLAEGLGCAVVYCHHYAKGDQWQRASIDRASGSGVFSRDADTLLAMTEIEVSDDMRKARTNAAWCSACAAALDELRPSWRDEVGEDDALSVTQMNDYLHRTDRALEDAVHKRTSAAYQASKRDSAWSIEGTFRELPPTEPVNVWFSYPIHAVDDAGVLADAQKEAAKPAWQKARGKAKEGRQKQAEEAVENTRKAFIEAISMARPGERPTAKDIAEYMGVTKRTIDTYVKKFGAKKVRVSDSDYRIELPETT